MNNGEQLYQSILLDLSQLPVENLPAVAAFLKTLAQQATTKQTNPLKTLAFAGAWNDWSEEEFQEFLRTVKEIRNEMFDREVEL